MRFRQYLIERNVLNTKDIDQEISNISINYKSRLGNNFSIFDKWMKTKFKSYIINDFNNTKEIIKYSKKDNSLPDTYDTRMGRYKVEGWAKKAYEKGDSLYLIKFYYDNDLLRKLDHFTDFIQNMDKPEKILKMGFQDVERAADL